MKDKKTYFTTPLKVLIVEDNKIDRKIIQSMLQESLPEGSLLKVSKTLTLARKQLNKIPFDIIILDLNLPDSKGLETLKKVNSEFPKVAILVNTGAYADAQGIQTLGIGAQDFLEKGQYTPYTLNKVLHYCVERKRLEIELKDAYDELKKTQNQLVQAEKMKVVGGLASGVAHEVKNPLATIIYGITYLEENLDKKKKEINTVLVNVKDAANRANNIITDLLNFSSLSKLKQEPYNLNDVVNNSFSLLSHLFGKNKIKVIKKLDSNMPLVSIDPNRIEQVVINLILNSVSAIGKNGKITVSTSKKKLSKSLSEIPAPSRNGFIPKENVAILTISDNGCGVPEDKLTQIFDPFFTTRRARGGIGLGLSVSLNIMKSHRGTLFIDNIKGGGAKATLILRA